MIAHFRIAALLLSTAVLLPFFLGCGGESHESKLVLHCGAGIRPAASELAEQFGRKHGVVVECNYEGSEVLLSTIKLTRRGDLYMPGDVHYVKKAADEGLVASQADACYFVPVILVQKGNPKEIRSLTDLTKPGIKVGLGNAEACAIGRKTVKIFAKNEIAVEQIDPNVKFRAVTVNDLGDKIKLGHLDAAIVWDATAAQFAGDTETVPIPRQQNVISTIAVGVLTCAEQPELAAEFVKFATSDAGRRIFENHHYTTDLPD